MIAEQDKIFTNLPKQQTLSLEQARIQGDWSGIAVFLKRGKLDLFREIQLSKLRERDEEGQLVSEKWQPFMERSATPFLVIDASCGVPGDVGFAHLIRYEAYKIIEGAVLTAFILGIENGYFYIPSHQSLWIQIIQEALDQCYASHFLGTKILGSSFSFNLSLHFGSCEYVSYNEDALVTSLAGERQRPGLLFGSPVLVHQVETIASISTILKRGGSWFSSLGTENSTGTRLFSFLGHVNKPCVVEESLGTSLRTVIDHYAGGVRGGWTHLNFIFPGGMMSKILPKSMCENLELSDESLHSAQSNLGKGAIIVVNRSIDFVLSILTAFQFFLRVSPASCVFCIKGLPWCAEILRNLSEKKKEGISAYLSQLIHLSHSLESRCECGYAQRALIPIKGLQYYEECYNHATWHPSHSLEQIQNG